MQTSQTATIVVRQKGKVDMLFVDSQTGGKSNRVQIKKLILTSLVLMLLPTTACSAQPTAIMKGVGIDIPQQDFVNMKAAGIDVLTTEWGMEKGVNRAKAFLDKADAAGLKVVLDGGFSYTAWGFTDDDWDTLPQGKRPVWQRDKVQTWVRALKDHPAVFAWDISNEAGENLPGGSDAENSQWPNTAITIKQLKQARTDVLKIDPNKPILIRMHAWDLRKPPFRAENPFDTGIADIVMLNLYSNYTRNNQLQFPQLIQQAGASYVKAIKAKDPDVKIWVAIAAFEQPYKFQRPTAASLARDIKQTLQIPSVEGIGFFKWGPAYQWDTGESWYLPETGPDLWDIIQRSIQ